ncbi:serine hydrolase domain-containing protein [Allorhodopirellula heiligendammensis]|uniref:Esterase EstB n=1 Tax=Allorhodopirellula heiligendammensis TaxID=2714739 RepID=A0A5C6C5P4_9BACT|nr:serine hydrolase domain-containing protein [Allorhodopirellula heiligendammensis]TWU19445.1 Esterase EstB [Allorhodopirellula heiligendammensis]|tara:strand:- start:266 stop:1516 length:1251 start_codon:yes stop_codon:yes gene_type:complete
MKLLVLPPIVLLLLISIASGEDLVISNWTEHGLSPESRASLESHLFESVDEGNVPGGSILILHAGEVIFRKGFGYAHLRHERPFSADAPFRIASLSKSIIATLTVILDERGDLDLDSPIDRYLPSASRLRLGSGAQPERLPTIAECLKHTAGFISDYDDGGRPWLVYTGRGKSLAEVVELEIEMPMARRPGESFAYSGIGYDIVGRVIEKVCDQPLDEVLQQELCQPLGMLDTTYFPDERTRQQMPSFYWQWRSDGHFRRQLDREQIPRDEYKSVGGGIVSTLDDLARFLLLHRNRGLVGNESFVDPITLERMYWRQKPGAFYGLGFTLGPQADDALPNWIFHSGSSGTMMWWDRQRDVIAIIATQHRRSAGEQKPGTPAQISLDTPSWQAMTKSQWIDPILEDIEIVERPNTRSR